MKELTINGKTYKSIQSAPMENCALPHAIQEIMQENKKEINNQRLANKTNTQKAPPPTAAVGECDSSAVHANGFDGEILNPVDILFERFWEEICNQPQWVMDTYHELWRIEETFKITKSDLVARPVYVSRIDPIEAHFLICFISLIIIRLF